MKYKYFVVRLGEKARAYEEQRSALLRLCSGQWRYIERERERDRQTDRGEREREHKITQSLRKTQNCTRSGTQEIHLRR